LAAAYIICSARRRTVALTGRPGKPKFAGSLTGIVPGPPSRLSGITSSSNGGYIPGVRPGQATSDYLHHAMSRITLAGAVFLVIIAVIPMLLNKLMNIPYAVAQFFGGTSILITVGVLLDTMRQMESHLLMRHYDGFLKKGRLKGRFGS
jgi:hypothetical protein